jgi:ketosteroid isomerase-like protein
MISLRTRGKDPVAKNGRMDSRRSRSKKASQKGKPRHVDVTGDRAYVVAPVRLDYKVKAKPKKLPSLFTAAVHKEAGGWRITGWAWTDL